MFETIPLFQLVIAYLVYRSAEKRNANNKWLWTLLAFLVPIIGAIIYYISVVNKKQ